MLVKSPGGHTYLNVGCGRVYSLHWNNIDIHARQGVRRHDIRRPLPYADCSFDGVYMSHVLEHLSLPKAKEVVGEFWRVLRPGGVVRLVVPDLEGICREYLRLLEAAARERNETNILRYNWIALELLDQMVRTKPGGMMHEVLESDAADDEYVRLRSGDDGGDYRPRSAVADKPAGTLPHVARRREGVVRRQARSAVRAMKRALVGPPDPRRTGEAHQWMHDRVSLRILLEGAGFVDFAVTSFDRSQIPDWEEYHFDTSRSGNGPRKPESIYVEARKPD